MKRRVDRAKLLTLREVAEELSVSAYTLREWIRQGRMRALKIGRDWRVEQKEMERFLDRAFRPAEHLLAPVIRIPSLADLSREKLGMGGGKR